MAALNVMTFSRADGSWSSMQGSEFPSCDEQVWDIRGYGFCGGYLQRIWSCHGEDTVTLEGM